MKVKKNRVNSINAIEFFNAVIKNGDNSLLADLKRITAKQRELDLKIDQIPYKDRDHALYIAFGPYKNPRYALSVLVEHGGNGSTTAAPMAKKLFKLIIDRHTLRQSVNNNTYLEI